MTLVELANEMLPTIKDLIEVDLDSTIYDKEILTHIQSSVIKLEAEGVPRPTDLTVEWFSMYVVTIAFDVTGSMNLDYNFIDAQDRRRENVQTLRLYLGARC